jgi:hypothetical protein
MSASKIFAVVFATLIAIAAAQDDAFDAGSAQEELPADINVAQLNEDPNLYAAAVELPLYTADRPVSGMATPLSFVFTFCGRGLNRRSISCSLFL